MFLRFFTSVDVLFHEMLHWWMLNISTDSHDYDGIMTFKHAIFYYKIFVRLLLRYTVHGSCLCGNTIQISSALSWFITSDSVSCNIISWAPMIPVGNMFQKWQNTAFGVSYLQMRNAWNIMRSPIPEIAEWNYIYLWRNIRLCWREVGSFRI